MFHRLVVSFGVACLLAGPFAAPARGGAPNPWARQRTPAAGPARAIGAYSAGCVAGAATLPVHDERWDLLRPGRHRNFGHPALVDFVRTLAARVREENLGRLRIGDLGQPRGGPAPNGHASHQSGLDVDLGYALAPRGDGPPLDLMVDHGRRSPAAGFGEAQIRLLRLAAEDPRVARIFVNPILKRALCDAPGDDRAWRARIRPWWGHDRHFHVRLACPADSPECRNQPALDANEGCGEALAWWFTDHSAEDRERAAADYGKRVGALPTLPEGCAALLPPPSRSGRPTRHRHPSKP